MQSGEICVLGALLRHLRKVEPDRARAVCVAAGRGEEALIEAFAREARLPADEAPAWIDAARFLVAGRQARACARCQEQCFSAGEAGACPQCKGPWQRGVLAAPKTVRFEPALEAQVRRLILDAAGRRRAQAQVAEARRLRESGKVGARPEAEVVPQDKSCAESALGPYRLLGLVGRGSSSWVYRAEDSRTGGTVALKVFYVEEGTPPAAVQERMARFRREAELAGSLEHPHLVPVGPLEQAGAWYFMAMPFIDGPSLAHLLEARAAAGPAEADRAPLLAALADVARGLHYAHCRGIVHRDVSPRNILFDPSGQAHLSDFGAAKSLEASSTLTAARAVVGTLAYASPERLQSESKADVRSDVYSLGVVLYEILTGRVPYRESQVAPLLVKILKEGPPAPRSLRADLPADLEALALKALQADPGRRPDSALAFAEALTACVEGTAAPVPAEPAGATAPASGAEGFRGFSFALGAMAATAVALLVAILMPSGRSADLSQAAAAYRAWSSAADSARAGERESLVRALAEAERAPVRDEAAVRVWKAGLAWGEGRSEDAATLLTEIVPPAELRAEALRIDGLARYFLAQRYGTAKRASRLLAVARQDFADLARSQPASAEGRFAEGMLSLIGNDLDGAFVRFHELSREAPADRAAALMEVWTLVLGRASGEADAAATAALQKFPEDPWMLLMRGLASLTRRQPGEAREIARRLAAARPAMAEATILFSTAALAAKQSAEAEAAARTALDLDPLAPGVHRLLAAAAEARGDLCAAAAALARAVDLEPELDGPEYRLADLFRRHGDADRARARAEEYLRRFPQGEFAEPARRLARGE